MTYAIAYAAASAISAMILWAMCAAAPLGWQDERGFFYGEPD